MKRISFKKCAIILASALLLCSCGKSTSVDTTTVQSQTKTIADIYTEITNSVELISPYCWDDEFISNYYAIDPTILQEYVFSMSEEPISAETIIIMKVADASSVTAIRDCLQVVVDEKKNEMENYLPEEYEIVAKSSVQTKDTYVWLVISKQADRINKIIKDGIQ